MRLRARMCVKVLALGSAVCVSLMEMHRFRMEVRLVFVSDSSRLMRMECGIGLGGGAGD